MTDLGVTQRMHFAPWDLRQSLEQQQAKSYRGTIAGYALFDTYNFKKLAVDVHSQLMQPHIAGLERATFERRALMKIAVISRV